MTLVGWTGVSRTYPGDVPVEALRPTDLTIGAGEYVAIVGPSGSGKSTMLNVLGLLDRPTTGSYELAGLDLESLSERARSALRARFFGFVFQAFHLIAAQSVQTNVELGMVYAGVPRNIRSKKAEAAIERVGLSHRRFARPSTLSGGERQRAAIARALTTEPQLLLCDEPTGNLDSGNAEQVLGLLDQLNTDGTAVVVVTHDAAVAGHAKRILQTRDGALVRDERVGTSPGFVPARHT